MTANVATHPSLTQAQLAELLAALTDEFGSEIAEQTMDGDPDELLLHAQELLDL